jgi:hypothetical protein
MLGTMGLLGRREVERKVSCGLELGRGSGDGANKV